MKKTLKLGTRRSLLATAQSRQVARSVEQSNPGVRVELVGIDTRGDQVLDIPLSQIEGKEFFVAELDQALLGGAVDFTVHSMKDLSLERPDTLTLAAIPPRENPRDVMLFAPDILDRLTAKETIRVGTSSPRRIENVVPFLQQALPHQDSTPALEVKEIRGNVNTRIGLLKLDDDHEKRIDAVVLAFAGLKRLYADKDGRAALQELLTGLRWMVLPLNECPAAPAQGGLAIECRSDDAETLAMLQHLHCARTAADISSERQILDVWGGGCHQRFGATQISIDPLGTLLYIRGRKPDDSPVEETRWQPGQTLAALAAPAWDGTAWRQAATVTDVPVTAAPPHWLPTSGALFLAHSRALPAAWVAQLSGGLQRVWTSGTASWFRLAGQGIWVEGCAEELGYQTIQSLLEETVLGLPAAQNWRVLTHSQAVDGWPQEEVIATYTLQAEVELTQEHPAVIELRRASSVFWSSTSQYEMFAPWVPEQCEHACRYGKTYYSLIKKGLKGLTAYPNTAEWQRHLEANKELTGIHRKAAE